MVEEQPGAPHQDEAPPDPISFPSQTRRRRQQRQGGVGKSTVSVNLASPPP